MLILVEPGLNLFLKFVDLDFLTADLMLVLSLFREHLGHLLSELIFFCENSSAVFFRRFSFQLHGILLLAALLV